MQIHIPDPVYSASERARANFRLAVGIALVLLLFFVGLSNDITRIGG